MLRLLFLCCFSASIYANDIMTYVESDGAILGRSTDIVQGRIVSFTTLKPAKKSCFSYVYKLQIDRSFKGAFVENDIVQVGSLNNRIEMKVGERVIVVLNNTKEGEFNFYEYCKYPRLDNTYSKNQIKITTGSISSTYKINSQEFNVIGCGSSKRILMEDELLRFESTSIEIDDQCKIMTGDYAALVSTIEKNTNGK